MESTEAKLSIKTSELKELQEVVNKINQAQLEIGQLETRKHMLLHSLATVQDELIRKISLGKDYKNEAMHYSVGQEVYGGHTICDIIEQDDKYSIYIKKEKDVLIWKDFNKNMAVSVEYNLQY